MPNRSGTHPAPSLDPLRYAALRWRSIGPFRGGRAVAVAGVPGDPRTAYFGAVGGGVWKTEDAGRIWRPVTDALPVSSIGALAVAPSDPKTVYAGSGEADMRSDIIHGNGLYRSTDAGATWTYAGLADTRQIGRILVDPRAPGTLLVAALGHAYAPNDARGVFRSTDGGATWTRTLFHDRDTGAIELASDPRMRVVFAALWQTRRPPWSVYPPSNGPGSGLYRSRDGGATWQPAGNGLPTAGLGKIGLAVAPSDPRRVYAVVDAKAGGLYRSDDGGAQWQLIDGDVRLWQRGWYFCHVVVDPRDPDTVYVSDTSLYRSKDGGAHFTAIKGSPDGDDFHQLWIDSADPRHLVLGSDQGTSVSLDGAATWSSWFNQPTGQFYHVAADRSYPYHLFGAQQDSGAAMILSRSDHRGIEARDWRPITAGGESDAIAPDPRDEHVVFGGEVDRENLLSNQTRSVSPTAGRPGIWRSEWTMPLAFGPDGALYASHQNVFRTTDGGRRWATISGDLVRPHPGTPATLDADTAADADGPEPRGVVYALAPSPLDAQLLWAGTDDGLVRLTRDGGRTWRDQTPAGLSAWSRVDTIEASRFDPRVAYVAVDRHRLDDDRPYVYATRDEGRSWRLATSGIPDGSFVYVVREDPVRPGLLYAGTETGVYVSLDDGGHWTSLRANMPVVSVHDLIVHDGDLAVATHGRAFWILDDVEPLRELAAGAGASRGLAASAGSLPHLFAPSPTVRTRPGNDEAEATPPEVPLGENPPNGAFLDYTLPAGASAAALEILDAAGHPMRRWSSNDVASPVKPSDVDYPAYWLTPPQRLSAEAGPHRFVWDFRTGRPSGPLAAPGRYVVRLVAGGRSSVEPLVLVRDPRVHATDADLQTQAAFASAIDDLRARVDEALTQAQTARTKTPADAARIDAIAGVVPVEDPRNSVGAASGDGATLRGEDRLLGQLFTSVESADAAPTADERAAWLPLRARALRSLATWHGYAR